MSRLLLRQISTARTVYRHTQLRSNLPSPWSCQTIARSLATSPSLPSDQYSAAEPATSAVSDNGIIRDAINSNVLHSSQHSETGAPAASAVDPSSPPTPSFPGAPEGPDIPDATTVTEAMPDATTVTETAQTLAHPPEAMASVFSRLFSGILPSKSEASTTVAEQGAVAAEQGAAAAEQATSSFADTLLTPAMTILNASHDMTGLPWWASIGLATVAIRVALLPFTVMTMKNSALMQALKDDIAYRREAVMEAARSGDRLAANQRQAEMQDFMGKAGVSPMRVLTGPFVQFPVFISFFVSIRRLAANDPTLTTGGIAWVSDLSVADPTYILPMFCGASLLAMTEYGGDTGSTKMSPQLKNVMRGVAVLSVPMTAWFPAAVFCYWVPNNIISVSLGAAMRTNFMKKRFGLLVDPSRIPGTRAFRARAATLAAQNAGASTQAISQSSAIASYIKGGGKPSESTVKPVLLKVRPPKKKKTTFQ